MVAVVEPEPGRAAAWPGARHRADGGGGRRRAQQRRCGRRDPRHADAAAARQAIAVLEASKHVEVEIQLCDVLAEARPSSPPSPAAGSTRYTGAAAGSTRATSGLPAGQGRRADDPAPGDDDVLLPADEHQRPGEPRSSTDRLLWHHAAHTEDLLAYQAAARRRRPCRGGTGPAGAGDRHGQSMQLVTADGAICTLSLSFNNDGPFGTTFRYISHSRTYVASYEDLTTGHGEPVDVSGVAVSMDGIELQDREFVGAILDGREPNASVAQVLPCSRCSTASRTSSPPTPAAAATAILPTGSPCGAHQRERSRRGVVTAPTGAAARGAWRAVAPAVQLARGPGRNMTGTRSSPSTKLPRRRGRSRARRARDPPAGRAAPRTAPAARGGPAAHPGSGGGRRHRRRRGRWASARCRTGPGRRTRPRPGWPTGTGAGCGRPRGPAGRGPPRQP